MEEWGIAAALHRRSARGVCAALLAFRHLRPSLVHCFADQACQGERVGSATAITIEIVRPNKDHEGFAV